MKHFVWIVLAAGVLLGVGRGLDLAFWIDPLTGLCTAGSVWWRYGALAAVTLLCLAAGRLAPGRAAALTRCRPVAGVPALLAAVSLAAAGVLRLCLGLTGVGAAIQAVLELLCGCWLACVGRSWLRTKWHRPTRTIAAAIAGSVLFYWSVLLRFMENSSSYHRVGPTVAIWQMLAALLFLGTLIRTLYLPDTADGRALCASGLWAFCMCACWELPQAAEFWIEGQGSLAALLSSGGMFFIGLLGGVCTLLSLRRGAPRPGESKVG